MRRPTAAQVLIQWLSDAGYDAGTVVSTAAASAGSGFIQVLTMPGGSMDWAKVRTSNLSVEAFAALDGSPDWSSARALAEDVAWRLADPHCGHSLVQVEHGEGTEPFMPAYLTTVEVSEPGDVPVDQEFAHVIVDVVLHWSVVEA